MPLNCHLPRIPLMLFLFLENFLVLIDLIIRWKEFRVVWEGQAEALGGASFFSFFPENLK